jgi:hypothetical protein
MAVTISDTWPSRIMSISVARPNSNWQKDQVAAFVMKDA